MNIETIKNEILGKEFSIIELSNKLQALGCEDVCDFGNWDEILKDGNVVVADSKNYENHIQIFFDIEALASEDEHITATIIKITDVTKF